MSLTASRSSKESSVSEKNCGGDEGGRAPSESRREWEGRVGDDGGAGEPGLGRLGGLNWCQV